MNHLTSKQIDSMHPARAEYVPIQTSPCSRRWMMRVFVPAVSTSRRCPMHLNHLFRAFALVVLCAFRLLDGSSLMAQNQFIESSAMDDSDTRSITKANFLFHFAASNEWPAELMEGPFRLIIIGNASLHAILSDKYAMKSIGTQSLEIVLLEDAELLKKEPFAHVIYSEESGETLQQISKSIRNQPVLLISDATDGLQSGALINFVAVNNRIRYEINSEEADKRELLIGNRILSWAVK